MGNFLYILVAPESLCRLDAPFWVPESLCKENGPPQAAKILCPLFWHPGVVGCKNHPKQSHGKNMTSRAPITRGPKSKKHEFGGREHFYVVIEIPDVACMTAAFYTLICAVIDPHIFPRVDARELMVPRVRMHGH